MSPRRIQDQGKVDANEEQILQAPNDPLAELVANSEVRDAILLLARVVTTQLSQQKVTLENPREVRGDNDPKYERMLKVRNDKRKLYPPCARCGKNHKNVCLWGKNACYRCGKTVHKLRDCRVKGENLQGAPKKRLLVSPCLNCGKSHQGECMAGKEGSYKCGDMGHEQRDYLVSTRLGREKNPNPQLQVVPYQGKGKQKVDNDHVLPPCAKCGRYHPGECVAGLGVCFVCGSTDHKLRHCPWAVKNENDSRRRSQPYPSRGPPSEHGTSSGKCKFYSFIVEIGKFVFVLI